MSACDEKQIMALYNKLTEKGKREMGSNYMWSDTLEKYGKKVIGPSFKGVFARDKLDYKNMQPGDTCLVNTKPSSHGGEHWCGVGCNSENQIVVYDSFGRKGAGLLHIPNAKDTDLDAEQDPVEVNCGPRAIAWCKIFTMNPRAAMLI